MLFLDFLDFSLSLFWASELCLAADIFSLSLLLEL